MQHGSRETIFFLPLSFVNTRGGKICPGRRDFERTVHSARENRFRRDLSRVIVSRHERISKRATKLILSYDVTELPPTFRTYLSELPSWNLSNLRAYLFLLRTCTNCLRLPSLSKYRKDINISFSFNTFRIGEFIPLIDTFEYIFVR